MKTCKFEKCNNPVWSGGFCKYHIPTKPLQAIRSSRTHAKAETIDNITTMRSFFRNVWKKRFHFSEVSGTYLGKEPLTIFFHHILPKEKYPQAELDEENIILLTTDEHGDVENNMYKFPEINRRREILKIKYNV
jgi:hypothetical protein